MKKPFDFTNLFFIIPIGLIIYLYLSVFQVAKNFYQQNCHLAGGLWIIPGILLHAGAAYLIIKSDGEFGKIIVGGILMALGFCAFAGFNFSVA